MKIHVIDIMGRAEEMDVQDYVGKELDDNEYGSLERAICMIRNNSNAMGRLIEHLAEAGVLTAPDVCHIVGSCAKAAEFCEDGE